MIKDIFSKLMPKILKSYHELHNDLPFLPQRMKIKQVEKLAANLHDKSQYDIHIRNLKPALINGFYFGESS